MASLIALDVARMTEPDFAALIRATENSPIGLSAQNVMADLIRGEAEAWTIVGSGGILVTKVLTRDGTSELYLVCWHGLALEAPLLSELALARNCSGISALGAEDAAELREANFSPVYSYYVMAVDSGEGGQDGGTDE